MKNKLSGIILTKNEEKNIEGCLKTLSGWVEEIIIIDSFSSDGTLSKAEKFGAKIYTCNKEDFSLRRKLGFLKAKNPWLLYVDADERVSVDLKKEIQTVIGDDNQKYNAFMLPRKNIFFGHLMKYGGWFPDYQTRLFKKKNLRGFFGKIHESPKVEGEIGRLKNCLIHLSHLSISKGFEKSAQWTALEADLLYKNQHVKVKSYHLFKIFFREFFFRVFLKMGLRDGTVGWLEGIIQAFNKFLVYAQLWEKQQSLGQ